MKKALVVTTVSSTIKAFLIPQISLLRSKGYKVEIATHVMGDLSEFQKHIQNTVVHNVPFNRNAKSLENVYAYKMIKKIIRNTEYDLIHVHTPIAAFLTRLASTNRNTVVYTAHGFHFNENGSSISNFIYKTMEKIAATKTDKLVVINKDDYEIGKSIIDPSKLQYIKGVGVDMNEYNKDIIDDKEKIAFKRELGINRDTKVITHIAEINSNKRQIDTVLAAEKLREMYGDNFVVLLAGRGPLHESIKEKIQELGLEKYVKCLGFRNDINKILSITDIGMLISLREGLPKSVMEMMAMKIPVLLTNIRGNRDLVKHNENGILVDIKSPNQIAEGWHRILTDSILANQFKEKSYNKILNEYSLEKVLYNLGRLYDELI
ncbi:glycosyltransferase family 4 protein [Bacillus cereus]|uniref:Glycosyltransferase family 1 protein n=1 Tax=Bacillus cereus TaxID=1396 RepID=A0A9X7G4J0_BACCE|nr:glycosyltransferase family 4 protein [Bacillus cereus]MCC2362270.1 glycosyltransferase family 4 protein [Bacillus cereus]PED43837.1 glycosyltransferase family 1 protein [Bacillus cereus]PEF17206.1 glycosyltransferase family 1 protein [Bacillus cereus]PES02770.1 glycosyltransferase family 1 protein [Bacillus cereus]PET04931.1 glycosyltransferase family 1 protein [Bacillus cereus]